MLDHNHKFIAIILPVFNSQEHLYECLESIKSQSYPFFNVFMVDDGSTDSSPKILQEYSNTDNRFIHLHKTNEGPSSARNFALDFIFKESTARQFEYISFIDSDDIVDKDFLSQLICCAARNSADIVVCNYFRFSSTQNTVTPIKNENREINITKTDFLRLIFSQEPWNLKNGCGGMMATKLYRASNLLQIRFPPAGMVEDEFFNLQLIGEVNVRKITYITNELYGYRNNPNSLTHNNDFQIKLLKCRLECFLYTKNNKIFTQQQQELAFCALAKIFVREILNGNTSAYAIILPHKDLFPQKLNDIKPPKKLSFRFNLFLHHPDLTRLYVFKRTLWDKLRFWR